jgi:uncharacterized protein DUF4232
MNVVAPPPHDELALLIREARARQRRRWVVGAAVAAGSAAALVGVYAIVGGHSSAARQGHGRRRPVAPLPRCRPEQLRVAERGDGAYTGHSVIDFSLGNVSTTPCTLRGRPRVQLVMRSGRLRAGGVYRLRNVHRGVTVPPRTVVLRPGGAASFLVVVVNQVGRAGPMPSRFCAWSRAFLITPPGSRSSVRAHYSLSDCGLAVTPFVAGRLDRYSFQ